MASRPLTETELADFQPPAEQQAGSVPISADLRGGIGFNVPAEVSGEIANIRQTAREAPYTGMGQFPEQDQFVGAVSRGLLEGSTAGLGEAGLEKAIADDRFDPNSPQFTNPDAFFVSEIIGSLAPIGRVTKAALATKALLTGGKQGGKAIVKAVPNLVKTGALTGLGYGAAGGEAQALRRDEDLEESIYSTLKGGAIGAGIGGVTGGLLSKAQASRLNPTETFLAFVKPKTGSKAQTSSFEFIDSGKLEQGVGSVKNFFKLPKNLTTEQAKDLTYATADKLISQVDDIANKFPKHTLLGSRLQQGLQREVLDNPLLSALNPKTQKELTESVLEISTDRTLKQAIALQKKLNARLKTSIQARKMGGDPRVNDEIAFLDTLRRENSKLIDDAITGLTGSTDNPYRRWGAVNELANIIDSRYQNLVNLGAQSKTAGLSGIIKKVKSLDFSGNEMKNADKFISNLFNKIPEYKIGQLPPALAAQRLGRSVQAPRPAPIPLTPQQQQAIQMAQSVRAPVAAPPISPQTLQAIIAQDIMAANPRGSPLAQPGFVPPNQAQAGELLQRIIEDAQRESARTAAGSNLGFF